MSLVTTMLKLGVKPMIVTAGLNDDFKQKFDADGVKYKVVPYEIKGGRFSAFRNYTSSKVWGRKVCKFIKSLPVDNTLLWIEGNYTFTSLDTKVVNRFKHVLQIQEMFILPGLKGYLYKKTIASLASHADAVIVPEYNRAYFYYLSFKLNKLPYVLPNKPAFIPSQKELEKLHEKYRQYDEIFSHKVILYQGIISSSRSDYIPVLEALKKLDVKKEFVFVFLGRDNAGYVDGLKKQGYSVEHIPFAPAPEYLYFTSRAYIGIVNYSPNCLNNIYCAPNKIYEYSAFGVPMLANDIPGLRYTVGIHGCASLYKDETEVDAALRDVIINHDRMSVIATEFFMKTEYESVLKTILDDLMVK